jgi:outer membrane protein OmpA-like peptidoglycan-associated protein
MPAISQTLNVFQKKDKTEISDIYMSEDKVEYNNSIGGTVMYAAGKRVNFMNLFAEVNKKNLIASAKAPSYNENKKAFVRGEDSGDYLRGSGVLKQYVLVRATDRLDFKLYTAESPVKNPVTTGDRIIGGNGQAQWDPSEEKKSSVQSNTFVFYVPVAIKPQQGAPYTEKEIKIFEIPKSSTSYNLAPIVIQDDNTLFDVNKSILKDTGKQAILAALGNVASANSITVTGGASQEGPQERNEELCKERAQAVVDFLKSTAFKNAEVKISDKMDIQPKESTEDRKTWRRVTLAIDGEYKVPVNKETKELVYKATEDEKKCDKIVIAQYTLEIQGSVIA